MINAAHTQHYCNIKLRGHTLARTLEAVSYFSGLGVYGWIPPRLSLGFFF